jgi:hypothetical protein
VFFIFSDGIDLSVLKDAPTSWALKVANLKHCVAWCGCVAVYFSVY